MRERLGTAAIVLFVLVDIVLVMVAFRHVTPATSGSPPPATPAPPAVPSSASPSPTIAPAAADASLFLSVAPDGTLLRSTRGSCPDAVAPVVEVSTDGGSTFAPVDVAADLSEVLRVQADGADDLWVVGADGDCALGVYRGGAEDGWGLSPGTDGAWHLLANPRRSAVHAPDGAVDTPCAPVSLSSIPGGARILCADGSVSGTTDAGSSWEELGRVRGATAIWFTSADHGYALGTSADCPAAVQETTDAAATWSELTCLGDVSSVGASAGAGPDGVHAPAAVAADGDTVAAQAGDLLQVSPDAGQTWQPAGG
ncbi:MAG TPA: hypothetical protein VFG63_00900 [Nocardioidaceae bacterium]|nr:hypothetical protein [Nocardioidaceae bacterium]